MRGSGETGRERSWLEPFAVRAIGALSWASAGRANSLRGGKPNPVSYTSSLAQEPRRYWTNMEIPVNLGEIALSEEFAPASSEKALFVWLLLAGSDKTSRNMNDHSSQPAGSANNHTDRLSSRGSKLAFLLLLLLVPGPVLRAELRLPAIIGDHMVLQQNLANPLWGWDAPGTQVTVTSPARPSPHRPDRMVNGR